MKKGVCLMPGVTDIGKFILFPIIVFQGFCFRVFGRMDDVPSARYWTDKTNIVAAVSAYELLMRLPSGEVVPYYSTNIDNLCTNFYAILFYVVSPPECFGKYFRLEEHEPSPILGTGYLPPVYQFGKLYYFPYKTMESRDDKEFWYGIASNDLFSMSAPSKERLFVGKIAGEVYYPRRQEAEEALRDLKSQRIKIEEEMSSLSNQIERAKADGIDVKKDPHYRKLRGRFFDLKWRLPGNAYRQKEMSMQIEKLRELEKTMPSDVTER